MIGVGGVSRFAWYYALPGALVSPGVSVTPGNGSKGSWVEMASGANVAYDVYQIEVNIHAGNSTGTARPLRLDIGIDPAGGTSYVVKIADILGGASGVHGSGMGYRYLFPLFIKAGSSVAVRSQSTSTTLHAAWIKFFGRPTNPDLVRAGQWAETVGTPSGADGVSFTPGNSGAEGSWVSLGTTTRPCWWWQVSVQINNATITALAYFIDLAWGDGTNKTMIQENVLLLAPDTSERLNFWCADVPGFADVPAGATLYVRGSCSLTAVTGCSALAHGIGG